MNLINGSGKSSADFNISLQSIYDELKRFQGKQKFLKNPTKKQETDIEANKVKGFDVQEYLLGLLLTYPEIYTMANQFLTPEDFEKNELQNIYRSLTSEYNQTLTDDEKREDEFVEYVYRSAEYGFELGGDRRRSA